MPEEKQKPEQKKVVDLTKDEELKDHDLDEVAGGACGNTVENSTYTCNCGSKVGKGNQNM
jgi:hypothetical protein